jgi:hypothetical protein
VAVLIALPVVLFAVPALLGRPLLPNDAITQNYPLRVLSGDLLARGELPLWNSFMWSGTALLGGLNAGALFPGTWLFAVLPGIAAWVANEVLTYAAAAVGLYVLLRMQRLVPLAAALAAASFAFAGFMGGHLSHTGLVQGMAFVPWMLVGVEGILRGRSPLAWWIVLATSGGLVVLSGEPRAVSNAAIVLAIYVVAMLAVRPHDRLRLLWWIGSALVVAFALGAVQLLPGLAFVHVSQRGSIDYSFFSKGSLGWNELPLLIAPYLLGANGPSPFSAAPPSIVDFLPNYVGASGLREIVGYVGLLPWVALVTVPFWRPRRDTARLWAWTGMIVVGLVLALGSNTPLGPLLARLPLYGGQRLQSRNLGIVDLGLAGVFAWWVDHVVRQARTRRRSRRDRFELGVGSVIPVLVIVFVLVTWSAATTVQRWLDTKTVSPTLGSDLAPYFVVVLGLAVGAIAFLAFRRRLSVRACSVILVAFVAIDIGVVVLNGELGVTDTSVLARDVSGVERLRADLGDGGRLAVYDPSHVVNGPLDSALTSDLHIVHDLPSAQGYGSVVDDTYDAQTQAHTLRHFSTDAIADGTADDLDVRVLLVPPAYVGPATPTSTPASIPPDAALIGALDPTHWARDGHFGPYAVYRNLGARGRAWFVGAAGSSGASVEHAAVSSQDHEVDTVRVLEPATLARSVAYAPGWVARVTDRDGRSTDVTARRHGLVQAVDVPAGTVQVEWSYHPPLLRVGAALTAAAALVLAGCVVVVARRRVRRRRSTAGAAVDHEVPDHQVPDHQIPDHRIPAQEEHSP